MAVNTHLIRNRYVLAADVVVIAIAAWIAFALRFGLFFMAAHSEFWLFTFTAIAVKVVVFHGFGLYRRYWRYASFWDLMAVVVANSVASILFGAVVVGFRLGELIPVLSRSV